MQEEITQGAVSLSVEAGKMTADLLQKALKKVLEEMQKKPSQRTLRQGKQTLHQLKQHGASLTNIEITEQNIQNIEVDSANELTVRDLRLDTGAAVRLFVDAGLSVSDAHLYEDTLEDYFKQVTGGEGIA